MALFRRLALIGFLLAAGVTLLSGYLRMSDNELRCGGPAPCALAEDQIAPTPPPWRATATKVHRALASGLTLIALILAGLAWTDRERRLPRVGALVALALVGLLAGVGVAARKSGAPAVVIANLGGGFALVAALWVLPPVPSIAADPQAARDLRRYAIAAIPLLALGVLLGAGCGALAARGWPHEAHRLLGWLTLLLLGALGGRTVALGGRYRGRGLVLLGLSLAVVISGAALAWLGLSATSVSVHNGLALALLLSVLSLERRLRATALGAPTERT